MHRVRAGDADIAWNSLGEGDPLLLIMGFVADSRMWIMQTPAFSQKYRTIVFDNRGSGQSSCPPPPFTMEQMASDALAVLDAAGAERAHLVGISMGGAIAQHVALKAPERVRSLTLAATWCAKNPYTERISAVGRSIINSAGEEAMVRASMLFLFTSKFIITQPDMVGIIENVALSEPAPREGVDAQWAALLEHETIDRLGELTMPVLVMCGRRDIMVPPELSEQIATAIPEAELRMFESGHAFNMEEAEGFNRAILEFLGAH